MSGLFLIGIVLNPPASAALDTGLPVGTADTGDTDTPPIETGDTDAPVDTGPIFTFPTADTGAPFCDACGGAADLAGDPGGTPCQEGCSTQGTAPVLWLGLVPLAILRRRARDSQSRSYST